MEAGGRLCVGGGVLPPTPLTAVREKGKYLPGESWRWCKVTMGDYTHLFHFLNELDSHEGALSVVLV